MDAASKIKSFVATLMVSFATTGYAQVDNQTGPAPLDYPCSCKENVAGIAGLAPEKTVAIGSSTNPGLATIVSAWLTKSPKFSANLTLQFGSNNTPNKLGTGVPVVPVSSTSAEGKPSQEPAGSIAMPMKFTERIPRIHLGEIVGDVIVCGHRICSGNKCYDVKDEPVVGTHCDRIEDEAGSSEEDPILVVPMAPPAPPNLEVAGSTSEDVESILGGLGKANVSVPVSSVVQLLVSNTELSTRLEMTELMMNERQVANEQVQALVERNAKLSTLVAVAEARQQLTEALTASIVDRAEMAIKLASIETKPGNNAESTNHRSVQTIQEDLSNIRKQIAILRRSQPVPFAQSYVGLPIPKPYVPTAQLTPMKSVEENQEQTSGEKECGTEITIK